MFRADRAAQGSDWRDWGGGKGVQGRERVTGAGGSVVFSGFSRGAVGDGWEEVEDWWGDRWSGWMGSRGHGV